MTKKIRTLSTKLTPGFNRAVIYTAYPNNIPVHFSIKFSKTTPGIQFEVGANNSILQNGIVSVQMHRNLDICKFTKTFFSLENTKTDKHDYRSRFVGIRKIYKDEIFKFLNERIDLNVPDDWNKVGQNTLNITGWKLYAYEDDIIYYFIQRRFYNKVAKLTVIRTAGLQFVTPRGEEAVNMYFENFQNNNEEGCETELEFLENISME